MKGNQRMRNKFMRKAAVAIALSATAALALTSCAGGGTGGGDNGGGAASGDERIQFAMMQPPKAALNPFSDDASKLSRLSIGEGLTALDEKIEVIPALATEWEQVDDLTWKFTLREGVKFHDGTDFTAEAVKNTLDKAAGAETPPRVLNGVKITTEVTGDNEVTITTDVPDPLLLNRLGNPQLSILAASAYKEDGTITPIGTGTGPFVLTETDDTTVATLDRFDDYWGDKAQIAGIDVAFVPDGAARAAAIRSGESDLAESIPVSQAVLLDETQGIPVASPRTNYLTLNNETGPFADPAVRAAARAAIDVDALVENVYEGNADPATGLLGPSMEWAAGLRGDVDSKAAPATVDGVAITLATYTDRAENVELAVQLQKQLEDVGFVVTQDVREYVNMEADMLAGAFDAVIISRGTLLDTGDPLSFMAADFTCEGGYNIAQACDPAVDALVSAGLQTPAGPERQQATMDAEAAILQLDMAVPLVHERVIWGDAGTFSGIIFDPLERRAIDQYTTAN